MRPQRLFVIVGSAGRTLDRPDEEHDNHDDHDDDVRGPDTDD